MRELTRIAIAASLLLAVAACEAKLVNIKDAAVTAKSAVTMEQVADAIKKAGLNKGWKMVETAPGRIVASLFVRGGKHLARVLIEFNTKTYSITYNHSYHLGYHDNRVHYRYNVWIRGLRLEIDKEILGL